jgi:hypothetical protein
MRFIIIIFIIFLIFSCKTTPTPKNDSVTSATVVEEEKIETKEIHGFRYDIPEDMEESPEEAKFYRFDNLLVDKGTNAVKSSKIIAIRHIINSDDKKLIDFAKKDMEYLANDKKIIYESKWVVPGFDDKNIEYVSYQFSYKQGNLTIYQKSVYLNDNITFYIVSLSSIEKSNIMDDKNKNYFFWSSIRVD